MIDFIVLLICCIFYIQLLLVLHARDSSYAIGLAEDVILHAWNDRYDIGLAENVVLRVYDCLLELYLRQMWLVL